MFTRRITMYCSKCGKEIHNDAKFCIYCGNKIKKNTPDHSKYERFDYTPVVLRAEQGDEEALRHYGRKRISLIGITFTCRARTRMQWTISYRNRTGAFLKISWRKNFRIRKLSFPGENGLF